MTKHNTPTSATHRNKFSIVALCFYRRKIYDGGIYIFILSHFICVYNDDKSMTKFLQTEARGGRDGRSYTMPTTSLSAHTAVLLLLLTSDFWYFFQFEMATTDFCVPMMTAWINNVMTGWLQVYIILIGTLNMMSTMLYAVVQ